MTTSETQYAVIIGGIKSMNAEIITNIFSRVQKKSIYDSARQIANCWGIISEKLGKKEAAELEDALNREGISAKAVPANIIVKLPAPSAVNKLDIRKGSLTLFIEGYKDQKVFWDKIAFLAAAKIERSETTTTVKKEGPGTGTKILRMGIMMTTGLPIGTGKTKEVKKTEHKTDVDYYIDIVLEEPFIYLRIDINNFDFTCLKEDIRHNIYGNFRALITKLDEMAVEAKRNQGAEFYINPNSIKQPVYSSLSDLNRECRWLTTVNVLKRKNLF
ncbi:MAG: hypothetical protein PF545_03265 [Elusimicrobia bacterium]|nr:hypothetical protein [Elusimicrobiota bacterium]